MRLICPICEAKYEIPEDAIPETGRDVQCANCGHAWFQMRLRPETAAPAASAPPAAEPPAAEPPAAEPPAENSAPEAEPAVPATAAPDTADPSPVSADPGGSFPESAQDLEPDLPEDPQPAPAAAEPVATSAYAVDEGVLAILREEAEREALARRAEAGTMENQPDLGIEAALPARKAKEPPVAVAQADAPEKPPARRDLLPDVEEINSTLRPSEQPSDTAVGPDDEAYEAPSSGGGFRAGFLLVMTVAILAAGVYVSAPKLAALVPSLSDPLASYVAAVDGVRVQLDGLMQKATTAINGQ